MEPTSSRYWRSSKDLHLMGRQCGCGHKYYKSTNFCTSCGRMGNVTEYALPRTGKVFSSTVTYSATEDLQLALKVPYTLATVELGGVKVPGIVDGSAEINDDVGCKVGFLGRTSEGLAIYRLVWEKMIRYALPKMAPKNSSRESKAPKNVGIEGYGVYAPRFRISTKEIARVWGAQDEGGQKSLPGKWDDSGVYAMNSALDALHHSGIQGKEVGDVMVGSESHPYAVNPTSTIVGELIGSDEAASDLEFACKAGTHAMRVLAAEVMANTIKYGLAIGTDSAQGAPSDALEYTAGDGAAAFILGNNKPIAILEGRPRSFCTDTPDFWRNEGEKYPRHGERFTGEPAYFRHTIGATKRLMTELGLEPKDFDYAVFHQPNSKFPRRAGKILGFKPDQVERGIVTDFIGNSYSACSMIGLCRVLDIAGPGERILLTSYGSGAGSDAFSFITTKHIIEKRERIRRSVDSWLGIDDKNLVEFVDYAIYAKQKGVIRMHE